MDKAQKLAREGTFTLETYHKQVRILEERDDCEAGCLLG